MPDKYSLLKKYWGYTSFRPLQEEVIDSILSGTDTVALFPTGGGKSLCYQLPALMMEGLCLVVSPLIALMKDQVQALSSRRIKAACIVSGMGKNEMSAVLSNCLCGGVRILYVSPERLRQRVFIEHFRRMKVSLIAVDEAHCISQWGYDFRPPYLQIADIREYHPEVPVLALTATATPAVVSDIKQHLRMVNCHEYRASYARANLSYNVVYDENKTVRLLRIASTLKGSGIVYVRSRRLSQQVASTLSSEGVPAVYYHAGLDAAERDRRQAEWMQGKCRVMVATNAFGMGIDKADVRFVVHWDLPDSVEAYFQEAGRAGRDGNLAYAVAFYSPSDNERLRRDLASSFPSVAFVRNTYRALCNFYRIPLGSGAESRYDFNLEEVCSAYGLPVREFFSACRFLEREGLVSLPAREEVASTVFIPIGRDEVYRFQVDHLRYGHLLQAMIRMYPGLFMAAVAINEKKVASHCLMDTPEVAKALAELHAMHIVEYHPRTGQPQIIFPVGRVQEADIYLGQSNYDLLKTAAETRLEAIKKYASDNGTCRSRQLLAYFGEVEQVGDCGICDVCRQRRPARRVTEEDIIRMLEHNAVSPQDLCHLMESEGRSGAADILRQMLDEGTVYLDKNLLLRIS